MSSYVFIVSVLPPSSSMPVGSSGMITVAVLNTSSYYLGGVRIKIEGTSGLIPDPPAIYSDPQTLDVGKTTYFELFVDMTNYVRGCIAYAQVLMDDNTYYNDYSLVFSIPASGIAVPQLSAPSSIVHGNDLNFALSGYSPYASVIVAITDTSFSTTVTLDGSGTGTGFFSNIPVGTYTLTAVGALSVTFTVTGTQVPTLMVTNATLKHGDNLLYTASGFPAYSSILFVLSQGSWGVDSWTVSASSGGVGSGSHKLDATDMIPGTYSLYASSGTYTSNTVTITIEATTSVPTFTNVLLLDTSSRAVNKGSTATFNMKFTYAGPAIASSDGYLAKASIGNNTIIGFTEYATGTSAIAVTQGGDIAITINVNTALAGGLISGGNSYDVLIDIIKSGSSVLASGKIILPLYITVTNVDPTTPVITGLKINSDGVVKI